MNKNDNSRTIIGQVGEKIMICFTLYCFSRIFDISYSGATSKLISLFDYVSPEALTKVVNGQTRSNTYIEIINITSPESKRLIDSLLLERVQYVYKKIIGNNPEEKEKSAMVHELLKYALQQDQSVQKEIYINRNTDEIENYIYLMKNMQDTEIYSEKQTELSDTKILTDDNAVTETVPVIDTSKMTVDSFFSFIEKHVDDIKALQICCHTADMWLNPYGRRYRILQQLCDLKSQIQVIINTPTSVNAIFKHICDKNAYQLGLYRDLEEISRAWDNLAQSNDNIQLKKCDYLLFHNYICCEFKGNINSIMRVGLYEYGDSISDNKPHFNIDSNDEQFKLLKSEFEYLWNISE